MNLFKTSILSLISTVIKVLSSLVLNKAMSVYVGPTGLAVVGQLQNTLQLILVAAQGGMNSGLTKYTAEYTDTRAKHILWSTSFKLTIFCSIVVGFLLVVFSNLIALQSLGDIRFNYIFVCFGLTILLFSINQFILSILNGLQEIKFFITTNIIQNLFTLVYSVLLIVLFKLDGILFALVTNQSVVLFILVVRIKKSKIILLDFFKESFDFHEAKKLLVYSFMTFVSILTIPFSHIVIRNYITSTLSLEQAGYWQAIWYISATYLMVITTTLSVYYLPKLSSIKEKGKLRKEIKNAYILVIPIAIFGASIIFILRDFIVSIAFTPEFIPMLVLFKWQMIGDVIKVASWLLSYLMLAKSLTKSFVISEVTFATSFALLSMYFINEFGLVGVTYAYTINSLLYFLSMIFITKKVLWK